MRSSPWGRVCGRTGSFTDAAIELGISQAAVSRTLLSLEAVLGVRLLHRTSRSVAPTTAGVQVLARARHLLAAADDRWARRRSIRLEEIGDRTVVIDRRTGTTTTDLWPSGAGPILEDTKDIDDWLAVIATGRAVGITPESTITQYRREGIVFRPLRDTAPVPVRPIWRRHDPHPATHAAVALLTELYRSRSR